MQKNPYDVLGVSPTATDDEIKSAYRKLIRKYHPDANVNNPNKDAYEEKFEEIQKAYDTIMDIRSGKADPYGSYGGNSGNYDSVEFQAARNYIYSGAFREALNLLNRMDSANRNAEWYFLRAKANAGLDNRFNAMEDIAMAMRLDPNNLEYRSFNNELQNGGTYYAGQADESFGRCFLCDPGVCCNLCLLSLCCPCNGPC